MVDDRKVPEGYKVTDLGIIPSDWEVAEVKEAYGIYNNLRLPISGKIRETMQGKYPYYGPTGIQDYINEYRIDGEYSLIGEDGDHFLKWRNMPMTLLVTGKFNVNNHAHVIKGLKNQTEWFYWYFYHRDITAHLSRQGAGRYKLNKRTLETLKMTIPSLPEQKAISETLMDSDKLILSFEKLIDKKKKIKLGAMQQLLTGKKRLPGFSEQWEIKKLGDIVSINKGQLITEKDAQDGTIPVIAGGKKPAYYHSFPNRQGKTITISASGANAGYVGFYTEPIFASDCSTIGENNGYSIEFIYYQLSMLQENIYYAQTGGAQPHIHPKDLKPLLINYTNLKEQKAIAQVLSDMDTEIEALEEKLEKYKTIKQGMMQELLTGRIRLI